MFEANCWNMPKKKTGARKKAEKQRERQKGIKNSKQMRDIVELPCNLQIVGVYLSVLWYSKCFVYGVLNLIILPCFFFSRNVISAKCKWTSYKYKFSQSLLRHQWSTLWSVLTSSIVHLTIYKSLPKRTSELKFCSREYSSLINAVVIDPTNPKVKT